MTNLQEYPILWDRKTTIKQTSKDDSTGVAVYMSESEHDAVNFDKVMGDYCAIHLGHVEKHKSIDALIQAEDHIAFVEFKNGKIDKKVISEIKEKITHSLLAYGDITEATIATTRSEGVFILVYNKNKMEDSLRYIASTFGEKAKSPFQFRDLKRYEGFCFKEVYTYTELEFESYLKENNIA